MSNQHKLICKLSDGLIEHFKSDADIKGCSQTLDLVEDDSISLTLSVHKAKDDNPTLKLMKAEQRIEELEQQLHILDDRLRKRCEQVDTLRNGLLDVIGE